MCMLVVTWRSKSAVFLVMAAAQPVICNCCLDFCVVTKFQLDLVNLWASFIWHEVQYVSALWYVLNWYKLCA